MIGLDLGWREEVMDDSFLLLNFMHLAILSWAGNLVYLDLSFPSVQLEIML